MSKLIAVVYDAMQASMIALVETLQALDKRLTYLEDRVTKNGG